MIVVLQLFFQLFHEFRNKGIDESGKTLINFKGYAFN